MTLIRYTLFMEFTTFIAAVIIERAFAYFFIADYEQKPRVWIWRGIVSLTMTSSFLLACLNAIPGKALIAAFFCFVTLLLSLFSTACLFQRNYSKLRRLRNEPIGDSINYTLSIKFQLTENIRTMKVSFFHDTLMYSTFMKWVLDRSYERFLIAHKQRKSKKQKGHIEATCFRSTLITALIGSVMLGEWRRIIKRSPWLQLHLCCCSPITPTLNGVPERHESVQDYFNQLRQAWDK
ncbi:hypothetical protein GCK32_008724 [Trichostrongylus colubriformis]|uniref:Uncharacterized protein n=1 Tax=Trichostrongylus colubriformis TaxID=6319 RepID=A0AAN8FNG9_TRICO